MYNTIQCNAKPDCDGRRSQVQTINPTKRRPHIQIPGFMIPNNQTIFARVHEENSKNLTSLCPPLRRNRSLPAIASHLIAIDHRHRLDSASSCNRPASIANAQTIVCLCVLTLLQHRAMASQSQRTPAPRTYARLVLQKPSCTRH